MEQIQKQNKKHFDKLKRKEREREGQSYHAFHIIFLPLSLPPSLSLSLSLSPSLSLSLSPIAEDKEESEKLNVAIDCVRNILVYVNMVVKQTENRQKLQDYQSRLDSSHIDRSTHQITEKYKDINLTAEGRILLHEGILTWKISHRKTVG